MPDLPRTLNKREAKITPAVLRWFRERYPGSCAIEVKVGVGDSIPASAVKPHQMASLKAADTGFVHKLSDIARIKQPFDAFMLKGVPGYVVACFPKHKKCLVIDANRWNGARHDMAGYKNVIWIGKRPGA